MKRLVLVGSCVAAFLVCAGSAHASAIVPQFTSFGTLAAATFGGSGIPNDAVAITEFTDVQGVDVVLGLTATARFANPAVTNNGAGVFTAVAGGDVPATYARWNFDFYATGAGYTFDLLYDLNPGVGTDETVLGVAHISTYETPAPAGTLQNSYNNGFAFLNAGFPPFVIQPAFFPFNPNVAGEYSFALIARNALGTEVARSAINVNVPGVQAVPEPASLMLLGTGIAALFYRRRQKATASKA